MTDIYRNKQIKPIDLNRRPGYYDDVAGKAYTGRLDRGMSVGHDTFDIAKQVEFRGAANIDGTAQYLTKKHKLSFIPFVLGTIEIDYPDKSVLLGHLSQVGEVVYNFWVEHVDNKEIKLGFYLTDTGASAPATTNFIARLQLFNERAQN